MYTTPNKNRSSKTTQSRAKKVTVNSPLLAQLFGRCPRETFHACFRCWIVYLSNIPNLKYRKLKNCKWQKFGRNIVVISDTGKMLNGVKRCLTLPTILPTVMMEPFWAPAETNALETTWVTRNVPWEDTRDVLLLYFWFLPNISENRSKAGQFHLQINTDDFVEILFFHLKQKLILSDASSVHTHWRRLEITSLQEKKNKSSSIDQTPTLKPWTVRKAQKHVSYLNTWHQGLHAVLWWHVHPHGHVLLSFVVTWQEFKGLTGGSLIAVGHNYRSTFSGKSLTHCPTDATSTSWQQKRTWP